jgi:acyl-CoA thioester hydrolase
VSVFFWPTRIYWEDTDGGGVVYYANYLRFLERARTEWLRARGYSQQALARDPGVVFTVMSVRIDYRLPARLDDELLVTCVPRPEGAASLWFGQSIYRRTDARLQALAAGEGGALPAERGAAAPDLVASADVRIACVDARTFRPQRLPEFLRSAFAAQEPA